MEANSHISQKNLFLNSDATFKRFPRLGSKPGIFLLFFIYFLYFTHTNLIYAELVHIWSW